MKQLTSPDGQHSLNIPAEQLAEFQQRFPGYTVSDAPDPEPESDALPDPSLRLAARKAAGTKIVDDFLVESDSWGMGRIDAAAFLAKTQTVSAFLQLGRLEQARLALAATATDAYLTESVRAKYVAQITDALQKNP